ncbi:MAG TPA: hypothetical protein VF215_07705 [Thermoanaerobaculia bacterium]
MEATDFLAQRVPELRVKRSRSFHVDAAQHHGETRLVLKHVVLLEKTEERRMRLRIKQMFRSRFRSRLIARLV